MIEKLKKLRIKRLEAILIFLFSILIFSFMIKFIDTDLDVHIQKAIDTTTNQSDYPPNFLFYFTINLFSLFTGNLFFITTVTTIILSLSVTFKYIISKKIISELLPTPNNYKPKYLTFIAIATLLFFAIPDYYGLFIIKKIYLGHFVPIVWHNSTVIFLFPFVLLLFLFQIKILQHKRLPSTKELFLLTFLIFINIAIKPSFIFVFLPVFSLIILSNNKKNNIKKTILLLSPLLFGGLLIVAQYILIYYFQYGSFQTTDSHIALSTPFQVIRLWIPIWYIPIAFVSSYLLPIFTIILYPVVLKNKPFQYAIYLSLLGFLISAFIIETGPRASHGNFLWQTIICTYLLFLTNVIYLIPKFLNKTKFVDKKIYWLKIIFALHVISGIIYLLKIFITLDYH